MWTFSTRWYTEPYWVHWGRTVPECTEIFRGVKNIPVNRMLQIFRTHLPLIYTVTIYIISHIHILLKTLPFLVPNYLLEGHFLNLKWPSSKSNFNLSHPQIMTPKLDPVIKRVLKHLSLEPLKKLFHLHKHFSLLLYHIFHLALSPAFFSFSLSLPLRVENYRLWL